MSGAQTSRVDKCGRDDPDGCEECERAMISPRPPLQSIRRGYASACDVAPPSNGSRLSCGARKKKVSFHILRAARFKRLLGGAMRPLIECYTITRPHHNPT